MNLHPTFDPAMEARPARCGPRRSIGSAVVAAVYIAMLVGAPWIVRFAPAPDRSVLTVSQVAAQIAGPRCAAESKAGRVCETQGRAR